MAGGYVSDAFADIILTAVLKRDISVIPTNYFFGLTLVLPSDKNGTGLVAPTPAEYSRVSVTAATASWVSAGVGSRTMFSNVAITYPMAVTSWGNVLGYTIYDSLTNGIFLGYGILDPYIISAGLRARLPAGSISVALPF